MGDRLTHSCRQVHPLGCQHGWLKQISTLGPQVVVFCPFGADPEVVAELEAMGAKAAVGIGGAQSTCLLYTSRRG